MIVFVLKDVLKSFGLIEVLYNVDLVLEFGEVYVLIGENGVGKFMIMKILGGFLVLILG